MNFNSEMKANKTIRFQKRIDYGLIYVFISNK